MSQHYVEWLRLAAYALGALGGALVFFEFFQLPSYVEYDQEFGNYSLEFSPQEVTQYTWIGRVGAILLMVSYAFLFVALVLE